MERAEQESRVDRVLARGHTVIFPTRKELRVEPGVQDPPIGMAPGARPPVIRFWTSPARVDTG